jgi:hypothetical protein
MDKRCGSSGKAFQIQVVFLAPTPAKEKTWAPWSHFQYFMHCMLYTKWLWLALCGYCTKSMAKIGKKA